LGHAASVYNVEYSSDIELGGWVEHHLSKLVMYRTTERVHALLDVFNHLADMLGRRKDMAASEANLVLRSYANSTTVPNLSVSRNERDRDRLASLERIH